MILMPSPSRLSAAVVVISLCLAHCSSSNAGGTGDGGPQPSEDANPPADGATGNDSSTPDTTGDGAVDAATCTAVAQKCADTAMPDPGCGTTWSTAQRPSTWCPTFPYARVVTAPHCDGFDIVVLGATDTSSFYYYDLQTGVLVGIEGHGNNGTMCVAGQAPDVPLTDCDDAGGVTTVYCEADGSFADAP